MTELAWNIPWKYTHISRTSKIIRDTESTKQALLNQVQHPAFQSSQPSYSNMGPSACSESRMKEVLLSR